MFELSACEVWIRSDASVCACTEQFDWYQVRSSIVQLRNHLTHLECTALQWTETLLVALHYTGTELAHGGRRQLSVVRGDVG
jgi:hypothetical protein